MKALVYVQHLLGTGHTVRAAAIARALSDRGHHTVLVSGNALPATLDTAGLDVALLPPVRARDARFDALIDTDGRVIDDAWRERRAARLMEIVAEADPDILVTETFPLGRRQFAFELVPVLDAMHRRLPRPLVACSVRDILVRKSDPRKERKMADMLETWYDLALVHADPDFVKLSDSFPYADRIAALVRYTGYVHERRAGSGAQGTGGTDEVIVSSGGGPVGLNLLRVAIAARGRSHRAGTATWRVLVGAGHGDEDFQALAAAAGDGIVVERARPDFQNLIGRARVAGSQAGYNTVLDVLTAGCASVLVPFEEENESEQRLRADLLARSGHCTVLRERNLTPASLAAAVDEAVDRGRVTVPIRADGAATTADILTTEAERRARS